MRDIRERTEKKYSEQEPIQDVDLDASWWQEQMLSERSERATQLQTAVRAHKDIQKMHDACEEDASALQEEVESLHDTFQTYEELLQDCAKGMNEEKQKALTCTSEELPSCQDNLKSLEADLEALGRKNLELELAVKNLKDQDIMREMKRTEVETLNDLKLKNLVDELDMKNAQLEDTLSMIQAADLDRQAQMDSRGLQLSSRIKELEAQSTTCKAKGVGLGLAGAMTAGVITFMAARALAQKYYDMSTPPPEADFLMDHGGRDESEIMDRMRGRNRSFF